MAGWVVERMACVLSFSIDFCGGGEMGNAGELMKLLMFGQWMGDRAVSCVVGFWVKPDFLIPISWTVLDKSLLGWLSQK